MTAVATVDALGTMSYGSPSRSTPTSSHTSASASLSPGDIASACPTQRALAHDELGGQDHVTLAAVCAGLARAYQQPSRLTTDVVRRLGDHGEARADQRGPRRVIEARQGHV